MPKGSPELTEKRENEILDACEKIYRIKGFYGVNIKEISSQVSMTRPAIYHYFETKEEILLGLLIREYDQWCTELESVADDAAADTREELAQHMANTLSDKETLLRILNMNLYEIEQKSRLERLTKFKVQFQRSIRLLNKIIGTYQEGADERECIDFSETFSAYLFGVYPFTAHTEKQLVAMRMAGVAVHEPEIGDMVYRALLRMLPDKDIARKKE
ncbi:MAG: TetR/AcrR family transcriptional regulator [Anaerovoracaceae bacterium]